ncbi:S8 family serine peptidase [bacterium]|nr:S8 family serine peptidase [bacterium]
MILQIIRIFKVAVMCNLLFMVLLPSEVISQSYPSPEIERNNGIVVQFQGEVIGYGGVSDYYLYDDIILENDNVRGVFDLYNAEYIKPVFQDFVNSKYIDGQEVNLPSFSNTVLLVLFDENDINDCVEALSQLSEVILVSPNKIDFVGNTEDLGVNDEYIEDQWWLVGSDANPNVHINIKKAWDVVDLLGSHNTTIGLLDSGVWSGHEDIECTGDFGPCNQSPPGVDVWVSHGTKVFGVMGATSNNGLGISGVNTTADVVSYDINVCETNLLHYLSQIESAANYCDIIITCQTQDNDSNYVVLIEKELIRVKKMGVPFIAAAGNFDKNHLEFPARYGNVIAVGATDKSDSVHSNYNYGTAMDISGPGKDIVTTYYPNIYSAPDSNSSSYLFETEGTSYAAPIVAGVVGMLHDVRSDLRAEDFQGLVQASAKDIEQVGYDEYTGWGRVDAGAALSRLTSEYDLYLGSSTGSATVIDSSDYFKALLVDFNEILIDSTAYIIKQYELQKYVYWPPELNFTESVFCWGRYIETNGLNNIVPRLAHGIGALRMPILYNMNICTADEMDMTATGCTFSTYAYNVYSAIDTTYITTIGELNPSEVSFGFGVSGRVRERMPSIISTNTTISGSYWLDADIKVLDGATLTIEQGTDILVAPWDSSNLGTDISKCEIIVDGGLVINGVSGNNVVIKSGHPSPSTGDWSGILINPGNKSIDIYNLMLEHADIGIEACRNTTIETADISSCGTGVYIVNSGGLYRNITTNNCQNKGFYIVGRKNSSIFSSAAIDSCISENNLYGYFFDYGTDDCEIFGHSVARNNELDGVYCASPMTIGPFVSCEDNGQHGVHLNVGNTQIIDKVNTTDHSSGGGYYFEGNSNPTLTNCNISDNYIGVISLDGSQPCLGDITSDDCTGYNRILDHARYDIANHVGGYEIPAQLCWWSSIENGLPQVKILGQVSLMPFLENDPGISWRRAELPYHEMYWVSPVYPNPFNPLTRIDYNIGNTDIEVDLKIFDISGRLIRTLVSEVLLAGQHSSYWDGKDNKGKSSAAGTYFYQIQFGNKYSQSGKLTLIK